MIHSSHHARVDIVTLSTATCWNLCPEWNNETPCLCCRRSVIRRMRIIAYANKQIRSRTHINRNATASCLGNDSNESTEEVLFEIEEGIGEHYSNVTSIWCSCCQINRDHKKKRERLGRFTGQRLSSSFGCWLWISGQCVYTNSSMLHWETSNFMIYVEVKRHQIDGQIHLILRLFRAHFFVLDSVCLLVIKVRDAFKVCVLDFYGKLNNLAWKIKCILACCNKYLSRSLLIFIVGFEMTSNSQNNHISIVEFPKHQCNFSPKRILLIWEMDCLHFLL